MRHSKLFELLRTFPAARWRRFGEFLHSPYWNKSTDVTALFHYLDQFHPAFDHPQLDKKEVLARLALTRPPDEKSLAYLMSQTLALAENFLAAEALRDDPLQAGLLLLRQLRDAGLTRQLASALEQVKKKNARAPQPGALLSSRPFELALLEYETLTDPKQLQFNTLLQNAADRLDAFYLVHKLPLLCAMHNLERLLAVQYRSWLAPEIEQALSAGPAPDDPATATWWHAWQMTRHDDAEAFARLLDLLRENTAALAPAEQQLLYHYALNFCIRRINHFNDRSFYEKYLEINDLLLQKGLLLENGELLPRNFLNLLYAGLRTGKWDWTWNFIHQWRHCLPAASADNLFAYGLAQWHYFQKNYGEAQQALARVEFQDFLLALGARSLLVKILYETNQTELLFAALEANRLFLLRGERIEPHLRRQMQQFMDFTRRLAKLDLPDPAKLQALTDRLPPATEIMHRDWLEEMLRKKVGR